MRKLDQSSKNLKIKTKTPKNSKDSYENKKIGELINKDAQKLLILRSILKDKKLLVTYILGGTAIFCGYLVLGYISLIIDLIGGVVTWIYLKYRYKLPESEEYERTTIVQYLDTQNFMGKQLRTYSIPKIQWDNIFKSGLSNPVRTKFGEGYIAKKLKLSKNQKIVYKIEFEHIHLEHIYLADTEKILRLGRTILNDQNRKLL
ncbi:MAG: hypothetical protein QXQ25_04845 [Thermoplasmata archaeon]